MPVAQPDAAETLTASRSVAGALATTGLDPWRCMTTSELMQTDIGACAPDDELVTVLLLMRERRRGWVPVVVGKGSWSASSRTATPRWPC